MAKAYASDAYRKVCATGIQPTRHRLHVGARPAPVFQRRKSSEFTFATPTYHRERVAQLISL